MPYERLLDLEEVRIGSPGILHRMLINFAVDKMIQDGRGQTIVRELTRRCGENG